MKILTLPLDVIQNIYFRGREEAVIAAEDQFGSEIHLVVRCLDIPKIVGPLLNCAAIYSNASLSEPQPDAAIPDGPLPVLDWHTGRPTVDGEPRLILTLAGGATLTFTFPPAAAQQCGQALAQAGMVAASAASSAAHRPE